MSPPNLPTPEFFVPLGRLLDYVRGGHRLVPVHADDIRAGACVRGVCGVRWLRGGQEEEKWAEGDPCFPAGDLEMLWRCCTCWKVCPLLLPAHPAVPAVQARFQSSSRS